MERPNQMEEPVPVAASPNFEARSSIAYDSQNRLWVAYEASSAKWGKDFGAYETTGVSLYQDHTIRAKCFQGLAGIRDRGGLRPAFPGTAGEQVRGGRGRRRTRPRSGPCTLPDPEPGERRGRQYHRGEFRMGR